MSYGRSHCPYNTFLFSFVDLHVIGRRKLDHGKIGQDGCIV